MSNKVKRTKYLDHIISDSEHSRLQPVFEGSFCRALKNDINVCYSVINLLFLPLQESLTSQV